jgi:streptogramin lyase
MALWCPTNVRRYIPGLSITATGSLKERPMTQFRLFLTTLFATAMLAALPVGVKAQTASPSATPSPSVISTGSVVVSVASGMAEVHKPDGSLDRTLDTTSGGETTGSAFDGSQNLYITDFSAQKVSKFDPSGNLLGTFGSGYTGEPESILFSAAGNAYVGAADTNVIREFDSTGTPIMQFTVAVESRGTDWVDLASDQCTVFYTSEGTHVLRFNTCTNTQLANFNAQPLPGSSAFALRVLQDGGVLVSDTNAVVRLDSSGNLIKSYVPASANLLFAVNLDPDGKSFWTGDLETGDVFKIDLSTGNTLIHFKTASGVAEGISVKGEITASGGATATVMGPASTTVSGTAGQSVVAGTFTLKNTSSSTETFNTATIGLGNPAIFSSLTVQASFDESNSTGTDSAPSSSNVVTLTPSVVLTAGATANFMVTGTIAAGGATTAIPRGTGIMVARLTDFYAGPRIDLLGLIIGIAFIGLVMLPGSRTQRLFLMVIPLILIAASQYGCDPCPKCTHGNSPSSSTVTLTDVSGKDPGQNTVKVGGTPLQLNTVNRK